MKSIFDDLDQLIEQAVAKATKTEKSLQQKQAKNVKERGLEADKKENAEEVEEADDEEKKDEPDDESAEKIKGKAPDEKSGSSKSGKAEKSDEESPGTKTSKKLDDPPEKTLVDPKFDDISNKINVLRGSGSLRDEKVSSAVKAYLGSLKPAEKSALLTYLTNLSQIMTSVKSPSDVKDPEKQGIKIVFKKKVDTEKQDMVKDVEKDKDSSVIFVGEK
jgi:hypothetical protein